MSDSEQTLVTYLDLACASQQRRRLSESDKLTVLAAVAGSQLGWPEVAEACRTQVLAHNPRHLVRRWPTIEAALATERFQLYLKHVQRQYPPERAEYMLGCLGQRPVFTGSSAHEMANRCWTKLSRRAAERADGSTVGGPTAVPTGRPMADVGQAAERRTRRAAAASGAQPPVSPGRCQTAARPQGQPGVFVVALLGRRGLAGRGGGDLGRPPAGIDGRPQATGRQYSWFIKAVGGDSCRRISPTHPAVAGQVPAAPTAVCGGHDESRHVISGDRPQVRRGIQVGRACGLYRLKSRRGRSITALATKVRSAGSSRTGGGCRCLAKSGVLAQKVRFSKRRDTPLVFFTGRIGDVLGRGARVTQARNPGGPRSPSGWCVIRPRIALGRRSPLVARTPPRPKTTQCFSTGTCCSWLCWRGPWRFLTCRVPSRPKNFGAA